MSMLLSLSVRIVEAPCKTNLNLPFEELAMLAAESGYSAVCMRASAGGVLTPAAELQKMKAVVDQLGLTVSMVTADSDVPLNNENGPNSLRDIRPSLDVAETLGCDLIRICMKKPEDIPFARQAADLAADRGIRLAHQCHTTSLFEQVDGILGVLGEIDRPNFGIIYEPANLMLCGETYGAETLKRLQPHIVNAYVQNHRLDPNGADCLPTFCRGDVRFDHLVVWDEGGVDMEAMFDGLKQIDYSGFFTIHQAQGIQTVEEAKSFATRCAEFVRHGEK